MRQPVEEEKLQQQFASADSLQEFLATVDEDVKDRLNTVVTHDPDDERGKVVLVGGVHGGQKTGDAVRNVIDTEQPDSVAVELGPIQYRLFKLIKPPSSSLEPVIGMIEGRRTGASIHPIDKCRAWIRMMEVKYAPTPTRLYALFDVIRKLVAITAGIAGIALTALGNLTVAFPLIVLSSFLVWQWASQYRSTDPDREYDYALIAIITSLDESRRSNPFKRMINRQRDAHMANQIKALREDGKDVVAIVGYNHLDGLMARIDSEEEAWDCTNFDAYN